MSETTDDKVDSDNNVGNYEAAKNLTQNEYIGANDVVRAFSKTSGDAEAGEELKDQVLEGSEPLQRKQSMFSHGFLSPKIAFERQKLLISFLSNWAIMTTGILCIFSIYWGALYRRSDYYPRIRMLMVNEDVAVDGVQPLIGQAAAFAATSETMKRYATIEVISASEFESKHKHEQPNQPFNSTQQVDKIVHHQKYWSVYHIKANTTYKLFQALKNADTSYNPSAEDVSVDCVYETGRDILAMNSTISAVNLVFSQVFGPALVSKMVMAPLVANLSDAERRNLLTNAPALLSNVPVMQWVDRLPVWNTTTMAPLQVGMIFLIILTFFQFNFFSPTHLIIAKRIKRSHFVIYRMLAAQLSYFVLSLGYSFVSLAFQINFSKTFGKSGFLVYWMTSYLTMAAVGGANENVALFIIPVFGPLLGFWLIFWVISNISPTFFAMEVLPKFYRYGYAFPIHNASELFKVILNNSYKGQMGRNYGVLIAWVAINNAILPFALKFFGQRMAKKAQQGGP